MHLKTCSMKSVKSYIFCNRQKKKKKMTKKVYNNIMNSNKLYYTMDTIFMNSENSETSDPHRLLLNLLDKRDLKRNDEHIAV